MDNMTVFIIKLKCVSCIHSHIRRPYHHIKHLQPATSNKLESIVSLQLLCISLPTALCVDFCDTVMYVYIYLYIFPNYSS